MLINLVQTVSYILMVIMYAWIAKKMADLRTHGIDDDLEIEDRGNLAVGARRAGLYLGGMLAMSGVVIGASAGWVRDLIDMAIYGLLAYLLLFAARFINDRIVLPGVSNDEECSGGNTAVGLTEMGSYIATGLIIYGSIAGDGHDLVRGITGTLVFFVPGQIILLLLVFVYELVTPFKWSKEIKDGNNAAAIMIAGRMIAMGLILKNGLMGPSLGWSADFLSFGKSAGLGLLFLFAFSTLIDHLLLPNTNLRREVGTDRNIAAVTVTQAVTVGFAAVISNLV